MQMENDEIIGAKISAEQIDNMTNIKMVGTTEDILYLIARIIQSVSMKRGIEPLATIGSLALGLTEMIDDKAESSTQISIDCETLKQLLDHGEDDEAEE